MAYWQRAGGRKGTNRDMSNKMMMTKNVGGVMTSFLYNDPTSDDFLVSFLTYFVYDLISMLLHHMSIEI